MFSGGVERDQWHETGEWKKKVKGYLRYKTIFYNKVDLDV